MFWLLDSDATARLPRPRGFSLGRISVTGWGVGVVRPGSPRSGEFCEQLRVFIFRESLKAGPKPKWLMTASWLTLACRYTLSHGSWNKAKLKEQLSRPKKICFPKHEKLKHQASRNKYSFCAFLVFGFFTKLTTFKKKYLAASNSTIAQTNFRLFLKSYWIKNIKLLKERL